MLRRPAGTIEIHGQNFSIGPFCLIAASFFFLALPLAGQQRGPLPPPPPGTVIPSTPPPKSNAGPQEHVSHITNEPPSMPIDEIIQKFTQREEEFRKERDHFTYTQDFDFQTLDENGQVDGEMRKTTDILFTPDGKRYEHDVYAPVPTITRISFTQEDLDDVEKVWPFVMTPQELPKYEVKYVGRERVDELSTYVFDVAPKTLVKGQRYFQGRIWVDDKDLQIVKTAGTSTGLIRKKDNYAFPHFENYRENVEGHYWFPTYTRADDTLHFKFGDDIHIRVSVHYKNYKRFTTTIKIGNATQIDPPKP